MQVLKEISVYYFANATPKHTTTALSERLWCKISPKANKSIGERITSYLQNHHYHQLRRVDHGIHFQP